jgi:hypothetical protein
MKCIMKNYFKPVFFFIPLFSFCNNNNEIIDLLSSNEKEDKIIGAYKAGKSGSMDFVPLLVKDFADPRVSTNINFKGFSVYQEKAIALEKIFKKSPPVAITTDPDSIVIKFYMQLSREMKSR